MLGGDYRIDLHGRAVSVPRPDEHYLFDFRVVGGQGRPVASPERAGAHSRDFRRGLGIPRRAGVLVEDGFPLARRELHGADLQEVRGFGAAVGNLEFQFKNVGF